MRYLILLSLSVILLASCNFDKIPDRLVPAKENQFAVEYLNRLCAGDTAYCLNAVAYSELNTDGRQFISQAANFLKTQKVVRYRITTVDIKVGYENGKSYHYTFLNYEYTLDQCYAYFEMVLEKQNDGFIIKGFHLNTTTESLAKKYAFTLAGKSFIHYLFLILGISFVSFKIITIIVAAKTKMRRKGWWILFIVVSICSFYINWTTGAVGVKPLNFDFIGVSFSKDGVIAPWMVSVALPIGAICFWIKRRNLKRAAAADAEIAATYPPEEENEDKIV